MSRRSKKRKGQQQAKSTSGRPPDAGPLKSDAMQQALLSALAYKGEEPPNRLIGHSVGL